MLEKPPLPDEQIISRLQEDYGLGVTHLAFLPIGADLRTAVYRADTGDGNSYFLKLRRNFKEVIVRVPLFLKESGIREILVPLQTHSSQYWAGFGEYMMILYPFIEGQDGFERELTSEQRHILGAALKGIHTVQIPPELQKLIRKETFFSEWREDMKSFLELANHRTFTDPTAARLVEFIRHKRNEISRLIDRAEQLASRLQSGPLELVLCHSDLHGGNILIRTDGQPPVLFIVDWDDPILALKERDLMFIGGGIDAIWKSERDESMFYEGYGKADINPTALAYYRYERIIEDLAVISEQLMSSDQGGADREQAYRWFISNFEPGQTIEIADNTYKLMAENGSH